MPFTGDVHFLPKPLNCGGLYRSIAHKDFIGSHPFRTACPPLPSICANRPTPPSKRSILIVKALLLYELRRHTAQARGTGYSFQYTSHLPSQNRSRLALWFYAIAFNDLRDLWLRFGCHRFVTDAIGHGRTLIHRFGNAKLEKSGHAPPSTKQCETLGTPMVRSTIEISEEVFENVHFFLLPEKRFSSRHRQLPLLQTYPYRHPCQFLLLPFLPQLLLEQHLRHLRRHRRYIMNEKSENRK
jgi:hypothetical protein